MRTLTILFMGLAACSEFKMYEEDARADAVDGAADVQTRDDQARDVQIQSDDAADRGDAPQTDAVDSVDAAPSCAAPDVTTSDASCGPGTTSCCAGTTCAARHVCLIGNFNTCDPCGGDRQLCCPGQTCDSGATCMNGVCNAGASWVDLAACRPFINSNCRDPIGAMAGTSCSQSDYRFYFTIDLGAVHRVSRIIPDWAFSGCAGTDRCGNSTNWYIDSYTIDVSMDGTNFSIVSMGTSPHSTFTVVDFAAPMALRYVRVRASSAGDFIGMRHVAVLAH